ncbi:MAG TPA: hypothetical protein VFI28_07515 [Candidatus Limnocylindrales bacterium]|nr:hypothetical protein [Candidatus Limnocylindrales bacterium]
MSELEDRIARLQHLLASGEGDNEVLTHSLSMLRLLRTELELVAAD